MIAANQPSAPPPQTVTRPSVVLVPLDAFGERVAEAVAETIAAAEPARGATCQVVSAASGLDRRALVSALLAVEQAAGASGARILVWLIGDLAADDPAMPLALAREVMHALGSAIGPYQFQIDARGFWQGGPFIAREAAASGGDGGSGAAPADGGTGSDAPTVRQPSPPTLHKALEPLASIHDRATGLLSVGHWIVTGVSGGQAGPLIQTAAELVEVCTVALEAIVLTSSWPDLAVHPFFRCDAGSPESDRLVAVAARLAYHPADEIARWVGERIAAERLAGFAMPPVADDDGAGAVGIASANGPSEPASSLAHVFEGVRLGPPGEDQGPAAPVVPASWLASRVTLVRRLGQTVIGLRAGLTRWRGTVANSVAAETGRLSAAGVTATGEALARVQADLDAALHEDNGGLHRALAAARAAERALQEEAQRVAAQALPFPSPRPWTLATIAAAQDQLAGLIARQAEPTALLIYSLATLALLVLAAWYPLTRAFPDGRGQLYAVGGPLVVILAFAGVLGPIARFLLRRKLGEHGPLVAATLALVNQLATDARGMLGALSARTRLRAIRQAAAVAGEYRRDLARVMALARQRVDELATVPPTAGTFAVALAARPTTVREPLLEHDAIVDLAAETLARYRTALTEVPVGLTAPPAERSAVPGRWYSPAADAALAAVEAYVLDQCRQITTRGPQLSASELQRLVRRLTSPLPPLAPLQAAALDRGTVALVLPTPGRGAHLPVADPTMAYEPASVVRSVLPRAHTGALASPNKLYALKVWSGLAIDDLADLPTREDDGPVPHAEPAPPDPPAAPPAGSRPPRRRSGRRTAPDADAGDGTV